MLLRKLGAAAAAVGFQARDLPVSPGLPRTEPAASRHELRRNAE